MSVVFLHVIFPCFGAVSLEHVFTNIERNLCKQQHIIYKTVKKPAVVDKIQANIFNDIMDSKIAL